MTVTPWITLTDVEPLLQRSLEADEWIAPLILHGQGLVEAEISTQDPTDLPVGLTAILAQIVARLWRAGQAANANPAGNQQETLGPHTFTAGNFSAGWGLTNGERDQLARYRSKLWVQPTHRADNLETPPGLIADTAGGDPINWIDAADMPPEAAT